MFVEGEIFEWYHPVGSAVYCHSDTLNDNVNPFDEENFGKFGFNQGLSHSGLDGFDFDGVTHVSFTLSPDWIESSSLSYLYNMMVLPILGGECKSASDIDDMVAAEKPLCVSEEETQIDFLRLCYDSPDERYDKNTINIVLNTEASIADAIIITKIKRSEETV